MNKKPNWKLIFNVSSLIIPIIMLVYFLVSENGVMDLIKSATNLNWWWIVIAILSQYGNVLIDAFILFRFTNNYDKKYNFAKSLKATAVGQFFSVITPGAVGGQPMQVYCMKKQKVDTGIATSSLIQKFLVYQTIITVYSFISFLSNLEIFNNNLGPAMISLAAFGFTSHLLVIVLLYMFSFSKSITLKLIKGIYNFLSKMKIIKNPGEASKKLELQLEIFHESNLKLYKNKKMLLLTCVLTVVQLTFIFIIPYEIYRAFNLYGASPFDMITGQAFVTMVSSFVPLPGGSGAAEGIFYIFFSSYFAQNIIKSAILMWRIITYFLNIVVFAPFCRVGSPSETKEVLEKI